MSLFTLFPTLRSQPISRVLRDSRPLWAALDAFDHITDDFSRPYPGAWIDADESDTAYTFTVALPGFKRDQVTVEVEDEGYLTVSATRSGAKPARHETRTITLPTDADSTKVEAKLEDGLLTVTVAKVAKPTPPAPRKVTIT